MAINQLLSTMPEITLEPQYIVQFEAIDPDSGAAVTGVTVSNVSLTTLQDADFSPTAPVGPFQLIPLDVQPQEG